MTTTAEEGNDTTVELDEDLASGGDVSIDPPDADPEKIPARFTDHPEELGRPVGYRNTKPGKMLGDVLAPTAPAADEQVQSISLSLIRPSPTNPRKTFTGIEELAQSITKHGLLQAIRARPRGKNGSSYFEIVFGERRYRAAKLAGMHEIPAIVREMSDKEVLEVQLIENLQRQDVDQLEEADGYRLLHEKHGYTVEGIADSIKKSVGYVYSRLKLCSLTEVAREALAAGKIHPSVAILVARIPASLQKDAIKELEPEEAWDEVTGEHRKSLDPVGAREAFHRIQRKFMLRLADAPFDRGDAKLVPAAGACASCPKRTGSQPELFADVKAPDTCTDPTCFGKKRDAAWEVTKAAAEEIGREVLDGKAAKEVFEKYSGTTLVHNSGYVDLDAKDYRDGSSRTHRERIGKRLDVGKVTLVRDAEGKVRELVATSVLKSMLPKPRVEKSEARQAERLKVTKESASEKLKRESERGGRTAALALVVAKVKKQDLSKALLQMLVERELDVCDEPEVAERWFGAGVAGKRDQEQAAVAKLDAPALRGFLVELALAGDVGYVPRGLGLKSPLDQACASLKIDVKQLVAKELARLKAEAKLPVAKAALDRMPKKDAKAIAVAAKSLKSKGAKKK